MNLEELQLDCAIKKKGIALYFGINFYLVYCTDNSFNIITYPY